MKRKTSTELEAEIIAMSKKKAAFDDALIELEKEYLARLDEEQKDGH